MNMFRKLFWGAAAILFSQASFATISNFEATSDATSVMYSYSFTGTPAYLQVYLDTDRIASTGFSFGGLGANYLIENGTLYQYSGTGGSNWAWRVVTNVTMERRTSDVRWTALRSSLGSPTAINVIAATTNRDQSTILNQTLSASSTVTWTRCAEENGTCAFTGTREVRYGVNGTYAVRTATGSIACNNATFGDLVVGAIKYCDYSSVSQSAPGTTTTTLRPVVTTTTLVQQPPPTGSMSQVNFSSTSAQIANPERGFVRGSYDCVNSTVSASTLSSWKANDGQTMIWFNCYLSSFKTGPISQAALDRIQANFNAVRTAGFKLVVRFSYTQNPTLGDDAAPSVVHGHLDQLRPILQSNGDIIATMQAGFVGAWGEWDSSANFGFWHNRTAQNWADRKALTDKILATLPANRTIQHHMVYDKQRLYSITSPVTASEAFMNIPKARIGFHHDCFLASSTDMGGYTNYATEYPFISEDTKYVPMGGETCKVNSPRSDCPTALKELAGMHWSYLNFSYNVQVLDTWRAQGCFETVKSKLGYRFVLQNASFSSNAKIGGQINVSFNIVNQGFAAPFNPRGLELILRNTSTGAVYRIAMSADPRRWLPGTTINVDQTLTLPSNLPPGNYVLLLNLPDPAAALYGKPAYSIQLANSGTWEASTGFNNLNFVLPVSQ